MQLEQTLRTLTALPAVSGHEAQAAEAVAELFRPYCDTVEVDKNGNMLGFRSCGRKNAKTVLLDAHLDQIGFLVTEVLDGGFVRFAPVGGVGALGTDANSLTPAIVHALPPDVRHAVGAAYSDALAPVLWLALPLAVAGLVLMLFLRETRLATTVDGSGHGADEGADDPRRRQGARRR